MSASSVGRLAQLVREHRTVVLSGAGLSTESGIPDYRGPHGSLRARTPMSYREFVQSAENRQRYWARSAAGWARIRDARPNAGHLAVARLEAAGLVVGVITQNVDRLHHAAGSRRVIELHGALADVRCLDCGRVEARDQLQRRVQAANPGWTESAAAAAVAAPDGDADLSPREVSTFSVPACLACGGTLKPDVVFFGENVPAPRVEQAMQLVDSAGALLVVGSSLAVFSGFRFARRAAERGIPIAIVNQGSTRADELAELRLDARTGEVLPLLAAALDDGLGTDDPGDEHGRQPQPAGGPA